MKTIALKGLDGMNPLGFLAAVGLHRILTLDHPYGARAPRLRWEVEGGWHAAIETVHEIDPVKAVMNHARRFVDSRPLAISYEDGTGSRRRDLKPPPGFWEDLHLSLLRNGRETWRGETWEFIAAYAPGHALDGKGKSKPTAFHFTAGNAQFVDTARKLASGLDEDHVKEALAGPWRHADALPQLRWDCERAERNHALLGYDPGPAKKTGTAGAEWLAFQALPLFPTAVARPRAGRVRVATTGFDRRGGDEGLVWPLWTVPATLPTVRALVQHRRLGGLSAHEREALGVRLVLRSAVRRSAQGYGAFAPPEVLPPAA